MKTVVTKIIYLYLQQDVVLMCQTMEKVFNQKVATMPAEVRLGSSNACT